MSPRVFDGFVPREVHEHQLVDEDTGEVTVTGYTVVHRESEWDDAAREQAMALSEWEAGACPCGCGQRAEDTLNKTQFWNVEKFVCSATRAKARVQRQWETDHEGLPEGWADGVVHYPVPAEAPPGYAEKQEKVRQRRRRRRGTTTEEVTDGGD